MGLDTALCNFDHYLQKHLKLGGLVSDETGKELVNQLVNAALEKPAIRQACEHVGLTASELVRIYTDCIVDLGSNPCVKSAASSLAPLMLAPTLIFLEGHRFVELVEQSESYASLASAINKMSQLIWAEHRRSRGVAQFSIDYSGTGIPGRELPNIIASAKKGCVVAISIILAGTFGLVLAATYWFL